MIICICRRVSDHTIARCARAGMGFDDVQMELGVATQCGQCESSARDIHSQCQTSAPVAHCHKAGEHSHTAPIQLANSILEGRSWTRSLHSSAALQAASA